MKEPSFEDLMANGEDVVEDSNQELPSVDTLLAEGEDVNEEQPSVETPVETSLVEDVQSLGSSALDVASDGLEYSASIARRVARATTPFNNVLSATVDAAVDQASDIYDRDVNKVHREIMPFGQRFNKSLESIRQAEANESDLGNTGVVADLAGTALGLSKVYKLLGLTNKVGKFYKTVDVLNKTTGAVDKVQKITKVGQATRALSDTAFLVGQEFDSKGLSEDLFTTGGYGLLFSSAAEALTGPVGKLASKTFGGVKGALKTADEAILKNSISDAVSATKASVSEFAEKHSLKSMDDIAKKVGLNDPEVIGDSVKVDKNINAVKDEVGQQLDTVWNRVKELGGEGTLDAPKRLGQIKDTLMDSPEASQFMDQLFLDPTSQTYKITSAFDLKDTLRKLNDGSIPIPPSIKGKTRERMFKTLRDTLTSERSNLIGGLKKKAAFKGQVSDIAERRVKAQTAVDNAKVGLESIDPLDNPEQFASIQANLKLREQTLKEVIGEADKLKGQGITQEGVGKAQNTLNDNIDVDVLLNSEKQINKLNSEYAQLRDFEDMVVNSRKSVPQTENGALFSTLASMIKRNTAAGSVGFAVGGPTGAAAAIATEKGARQAARMFARARGESNSTIIRGSLNKLMGTMDTIAQFNSDPTIHSFAMEMAKTFDDKSILPDEQWAKVEAVATKVSLYKNPLERTNKVVMERFEEIMNLASQEAPDLATSMADAMNNQEDMGSFMDTLSKDPRMTKFFAKGTGWDGRVYSQEDKQAAAQKIDSQSDIPTVEKNRLYKQIMNTGLVPDESSIVRRQINVPTPRDRKKLR